MSAVAFRLDGLRIRSIKNLREHWRTRARRTAQHRAIAKAACRAALAGAPAFREPWLTAGGLTVLLTRVGPRQLDDDNLQLALSAVRDGVAEALGIDDGDARVSFKYAQARGTYAAHVLLDVVGEGR